MQKDTDRLHIRTSAKEFGLMHQHQTIVSDAILIEEAKARASELGISEMH